MFPEQTEVQYTEPSLFSAGATPRFISPPLFWIRDMKAVIINGSPKGKTSMTRYLVRTIRKGITDLEYSELFVGKKIIRLEKNAEYWDSYMAEIKSADMIIWFFPVYVFAAPAQIMRFIELIHDRGCQHNFADTYTTAITTSGNFFDYTAHRYIQEVCEDLDMPYFDGFSGNMFTVQDEGVKSSLLSFAEDFKLHVQNRIPLPKRTLPLFNHDLVYQPTGVVNRPKHGNGKVLVVTDMTERDENLKHMIETFVSVVDVPVEVMNLNDVDIKGGCTGCASCLDTAECKYNDDFVQFYNDHPHLTNGLIYATSIGQRYFSSKLKQYYDRGFVNGHRPSLTWKATGFLISGSLRGQTNLQDILHAKSETGEIPLAGIVTDECANSEELTRSITAMAEKTRRLIDAPWIKPPTFLGIGGHKVLRDMIYEAKDLMKADHRYYEEQGLYDFPNQ
jgi:multimeric flavodoxin WrbA